MNDQVLSDLKTILVHMGPNMSLHMDQVALERCFGADSDALAAAEEFAKPECGFIRDQTGRKAGRFVRAYPEASA